MYGTNIRKACQLITVEETTVVVPVTKPIETTPDSVFASVPDEKLLKIGVPQESIARVKTIKDLDDLDKLDSVLPEDAFENIYNILDGENIDNVISTIEEGQAHNDGDKLLSDNNRRRFVEITDDNVLQDIISQGMDKWQIFLHPSQRKLVEADYKGTMKVSGGAGTGKTVAALHRLEASL